MASDLDTSNPFMAPSQLAAGGANPFAPNNPFEKQQPAPFATDEAPAAAATPQPVRHDDFGGADGGPPSSGGAFTPIALDSPFDAPSDESPFAAPSPSPPPPGVDNAAAAAAPVEEAAPPPPPPSPPPPPPPPSYESVYYDPGRYAAAEPPAPIEAAGAGPPATLPAPSAAALSGGDFEAEQSARAAAAGPDGRAAPQPPAPQLLVAVAQPEKMADMSSSWSVFGKTFVTFEVIFRGTGGPFGPRTEGNPRRRFTDFVGLSKRLHFTHRGYFVPVRPEKRLEGSLDASPEFIEERRMHLDSWLKQLAAHPVLRAAPALVRFLTTRGALDEDAGWAALRPPPKVLGARGLVSTDDGEGEGGVNSPRPGGGGGGGGGGGQGDRTASSVNALSVKSKSHFARVFKELKTTVKIAATPSAAPAGISELDTSFAAAKASHASLCKLLGHAAGKAERLIGRYAACCDALGDAGLAFVRLSKFEEAEVVRRTRYAADAMQQKKCAVDARSSGAACVRACRLGRAASGQLATILQPMHLFLALQPAVTRAVHDREEAMLTWQALAMDADRAKSKMEKVRASPLQSGDPIFGIGAQTAASKAASMEHLRLKIEARVGDAAEAQRQYELVRTRNAQEFMRLTTSSCAEFCSMAVGFARTHAAAGDRGVTIWHPLAEGIAVAPRSPAVVQAAMAARAKAQAAAAAAAAAAAMR